MKPSKCVRMTVWALLACLSAGCHEFSLRSQSPEGDAVEDEVAEDEFETKVRTRFIGDYTTIAGLNLLTLQGVGLVTQLDGTGGDPPPSVYRTRLLNDMKKRGVRSPNAILQSPSTALVVVRAYLPPLVRKGDRFDLEVRLPGNSDATSLNGGRLLETHLSEQAIVPGKGVLEGHIYALARGPVLISTGEGDKGSLAGVLRRGRILGGGVSKIDRDLSIYLRNDFRSVRNSRRIAQRIGQRFHSYNEYGLKEPLAEAKTDQNVLLKVPPRYRDNFPRYLQAVRKIAFRETPVAQRVRMERLKRDLTRPELSENAALELEAIGPQAVSLLKSGLKSPDLEVRFHSAMALAYLGESAGLKSLAEAAVQERAFRVYALAGMAAVDDGESNLLLRELLHAQTGEDGEVYDSAELRYGAFRALWRLDRNDPFIRGESFNDEFALHVLDTRGDAIVHLTHRRRAEIVLFGREQRFETPIAVRAGNDILVTGAAGSDKVTVSKFVPGQEDKEKVVSTRLADVIRTVAEYDASYPDVAQMLVQADKQYNLTSRIEIDALPRAGRVYYRPDDGDDPSERPSSTQVGNSNLTPNLFPATEGEDAEGGSDGAGTDGESSAFDSGAEPATAKDEQQDPASLADAGTPEHDDMTAEDDGSAQDGGNDPFRLFRFGRRPKSGKPAARQKSSAEQGGPPESQQRSSVIIEPLQ